MKKSEFNNLIHCGKCKGLLVQHSPREFGASCPYDIVNFEDECKHEYCISVYDDSCHVQLGKWFCKDCQTVIIK